MSGGFIIGGSRLLLLYFFPQQVEVVTGREEGVQCNDTLHLMCTLCERAKCKKKNYQFVSLYCKSLIFSVPLYLANLAFWT